jgi:tetratricopeptide (TPR) repeat protein
MLVDLGDEIGKEDRLTTAANLADHLEVESLEEALPALDKAVNDPLEEVRELAQQAFFRLARSAKIEQIAHYEKKLRQNPDDLVMLRLVLVLYFKYRLESEEINVRRQQQILQVIATIPGSDLAAPPLALLSPHLDDAAFDQAKALWFTQVDQNVNSAPVIGNAAKFVELYDASLSEEWFRRCVHLEPGNPKWRWCLGNLYKRKGRPSSEPETDWLAVSLSQFEKSLELAPENSTWSKLAWPSVAKAAFDAGEIHKARFYAEELIARGRQPWEINTRNNNFVRGRFLHQGNLILGRLALAEGDREEAKRRLMLAITPHLLHAGERDCVVQFFQQCAPLWITGRDVLARWIADVQNGKMPNFGANLTY